MSIEVKSKITDAIGWMIDYGVWDLISDYTSEENYCTLDNIYHCIVDSILPNNIEGLEGKNVEELKEQYSKEYPLLIAEAFENIAKDIREGHLEIKILFE